MFRIWLKHKSTFYNLKKLRHRPSDKKQKTKQNETDKLTNKAITTSLQYPGDYWKRRRKCSSGFHH